MYGIKNLLILSLLLTVAGCSSVNFFYNQLDWTLPYYVNRYVTLTDKQNELLDKQVLDLLSWHCDSQLEQYVAWFRRLAREVETGGITKKQIEQHNSELEEFINRLLDHASPPIGDVLYSIDAGQREELFSNFTQSNEEFRDGYIDSTPAGIQQELANEMDKRFRRWLGELQPGQQELITAWSKKAAAWQAERLITRQRWQQAMGYILDKREDREVFNRSIRRLIRHPQHLWTGRYRAIYARYRQSIIILVVDILARMKPAQQDYLVHKLERWAVDLKQLVCKKQTVVSNE